VPASSRHSTRRRSTADALPIFVKPQLSKLVKEPPAGPEWLHEIKFDGYRMHARLDHGDVRLLTRTGLNWTKKYPRIAEALRSLPVSQAYLDGELCGVRPDGTTSFNMIQAASDSGNADALVFFLFDLLHTDGEDFIERPLAERKSRLADLLRGVDLPLLYTDHQIGQGPAFYREVCTRALEGVVSKRADAPYVPGDRGLWLKTKCLNREEFIVVDGPIPKARAPMSGPCCWVITMSTVSSSTPAAAAPGSAMPSWSACGAGCSRSALRGCHSTHPRRAQRVLVRRSNCHGFIGCGRSWSSRSRSSPGRMKVCFGR
jgi:ATP-dependent DNA ligase